MTDFSKTLIHCSSIGPMMGNSEYRKRKDYEIAKKEYERVKAEYDSMDARAKGMARGIAKATKVDELKFSMDEAFKTKDEIIISVGFKTQLKRMYAYSKYNKWAAMEECESSYKTKGVRVEQASMAMINRVRGLDLKKNTAKYSNEYLVGVPDCIDEVTDTIVEVKSSWDAIKFFDLIDKELDTDYWWQVQGYCAITGAEKAMVCYCLVNTPEEIIQEHIDKARRRIRPNTEEDDKMFIELSSLIGSNMTFDDIPEAERIIAFNVTRNDEAIAKIYEKVDLCRKYLATVEQQHLNPSLWQRDTPPTSA